MPERDEELEQLAEGLKQMVLEGGLGTRSRWAMKHILEAWEGRQLNGIASLRISPKARGAVDASFTSDATGVSTRWECE